MAYKSSTKNPTVFKVRLYPTADQLVMFQKTAGCCRKVYNDFLDRKIKDYQFFKDTGVKKPRPSLTKYKSVYEFMKEVDSTALQQSLINLDRAYENFFKHGRGFPRFKKKGSHESFRCVQHNRIEDSSIKIGKLGFIKFRGLSDQCPEGIKIKSVTVSRSSDNNWYASILVDLDTSIYDHAHRHESCGIDLGVKKPLTVYHNSSGKGVGKFFGRKFSEDLKEKEKKRKKYQRQYARRQKGSKNQQKAKLKVGKAYFREAQFRKNYIEQISKKLAFTFQVVCMEDLNIKGMTKAVKRTLDGSPRKSVAAKSGLNREMMRLGLSNLISRIQHKTKRYGGSLILVDPKYTSQTCPECGTIDKANRKSQAVFLCVSCGHTDNADINAARNILHKGLLSLQ